MKPFCKRWFAVLMMSVLVLGTGIGAQAATTYSLNVSGGKVTFLSGTKTIKSYSAKTDNITLTADSSGSLLVCFFNTKGTYSRIKLGKQSTLDVSGRMTTLTMSSALSDSFAVTLAKDSEIGTMSVNSNGKLTIAGTVSSLTVGANAAVTLRSGASVNSALLSGSKATLAAPSGSAVSFVETVNGASASGAGIGKTGSSSSSGSNNENSSASQNNGVIELDISPLYAYEGDRLSDLTGELENCVEAYTIKDDEEVYGSFKWVSSSSTVVNRTGSYSFTFTPDNTRYKAIRGSIRVVIGGNGNGNGNGGGASDVTLKATTISASSGQRLRDLTPSLSSNVRAYNSNGNRIDGMVAWVPAETTRVTEKTTFEFTFYPTDMTYDEVTDYVTVNVTNAPDSSSSSSTTDKSGQTVEATPIDAASGSKLGDLTDQLKQNVKIFDKDGRAIDGSLRWVASSTLKVTDGKFYDFNFTPSNSRYKTMRAQVQIFTGGSSSSGTSGTSGSISGLRLQMAGDIKAGADSKRLYEYTEQTESLVRAYDEKGKRLEGMIEWAEADTTRVEKTGIYKFTFLPATRSETMRGHVRIAVSGSELELNARAISTTANRRLSELSTALQNNVTATNAAGRAIPGKTEWNQPGSTLITRGGTYTFLFTPNDRQYEPIDGEVRITIGVDAGNTETVKIDAADIYISSAKYLRDISRELSNNVTVFNESGSRIRGTVKWEDDGLYAAKTGTYTFIYVPSDGQYQNVMGDITVSVGRKRSGTDLRLEISPFEGDYNTRLSDLSSHLKDAVIAYDGDRNKVAGKLTWVTSPTTKVRRTAPYQFLFTPSSTRYRSMGGWVTIIVDE